MFVLRFDEPLPLLDPVYLLPGVPEALVVDALRENTCMENILHGILLGKYYIENILLGLLITWQVFYMQYYMGPPDAERRQSLRRM